MTTVTAPGQMDEIPDLLRVIGQAPLLVPGFLVSVATAVAIRRHVAGFLGSGPYLAVVVVAAFGLILAATLTPGIEGTSTGPRSCQVGSVRTPPWARLSDAGTALNVLLFVPLGVAVAALPRTRSKAILVAVAAMTPLAVEWLQLVVTPLGRACQAVDIVNNTAGVAAGMAAGAAASWAVGVGSRQNGGPGA